MVAIPGSPEIRPPKNKWREAGKTVDRVARSFPWKNHPLFNIGLLLVAISLPGDIKAVTENIANLPPVGSLTNTWETGSLLLSSFGLLLEGIDIGLTVQQASSGRQKSRR